MKKEQTLATLENAFVDVIRRLPGADGPVHNDWFMAGESPDRKGIYAVFMRPFEEEGDVITGTELGTAKDVAKLAKDDDRVRELALAFLRAVAQGQAAETKKKAAPPKKKAKAKAKKKTAPPKKKAKAKAAAKPKKKAKAARKK
jgi:hypothetical protein